MSRPGRSRRPIRTVQLSGRRSEVVLAPIAERRRGEGATDADFDRLHSAHHRAILAYCARRAPRAEAWDAAAEVFVAAWRRLAEMPPPEAARAWLHGVAYRVLTGDRRRGPSPEGPFFLEVP